MTERVQIAYEITGAQQGAEQISALKTSVDGVGTATQQAAPSVRAFEEVTQQAGAGAAAAAMGTDNLGNSARQVASHVQGLSGLVANLAGQLGTQGGQGAHLVGALAGVAAQSIALGTTLGPGGIVVGAIAGLTPLILEWADSSDVATNATDALTQSQHRFSLQAADSLTAIDRLIQSQRQLANDASRRDRIDQGLGTVDEQFAAAELAGRRVGELRVQLANVVQQISREDAENSGHSAALEERRVQLAHEVNAALTESHRLGALAGQAQEEERQIATDILTIDTEDAVARERAHRATHDSAAARRQELEAARAQRELEQAAMHGSGIVGNGAIVAMLQADVQQYEQQLDHFREQDRAKQHQVEEAARAEITKTHALEERVQADKTAKEHAYQQLRMQHEQEFVSALQNTGSQIGGVFGTAFESAIQGQENFGAALLRGSKQALLQLGERYIAEGAGALLEAVGFAFTNPPAAAAKAIEGGGKVALGVSLGAAGAAITPPPAPGAAPPPVSSSQAKSSGDRGPAPVVVNINSPSVIGGTQAQWGRAAAASIVQAQQRYGGRP